MQKAEKAPRIPNYRKQKQGKGKYRAFVQLDGRRYYLGKYNSKESRAKYHRLVAEWMSNGCTMPVDPEDITMTELIARFLKYAEIYYLKPDGSYSCELDKYRRMLKLLRKYYGDILAMDFGPLAFKAIRQMLIDEDLKHRVINQMMGRVKNIFKWATENELVPPDVWKKLDSVKGLTKGRNGVRESKNLTTVPNEQVEAIKPYVSPQIWTIIQLQLLTGARQGELLSLRAVDIDMSGDVWEYLPKKHKNAYRGHTSFIPFGKQAQEILKPFIDNRPEDSHLFCPQEAEQERRTKQHANRKTPIGYGNSPGTNRKEKPLRRPKMYYNSQSYRRAIVRACENAKVPEWTPHQLRHNAATHFREVGGLDAAQAMLNHKSIETTQIYAELQQQKATEIARLHG